MSFLKFISLFFISTLIFSCVEKTTYSGKIISSDDLANLNISNKTQLIDRLGKPSYVDNLQKKYFYFTEKQKIKNFYDKKVEYSYLFVFSLDDKDKIISSQSINLLEKDLGIYQKKETSNNIIKRGVLEKIFGGIGPNPNNIPNTP